MEKRVEASGRGRKAFLERRTLFALLGGQTALLLMFHCPSDYPRFAFPKSCGNKGETSRDESSNIYLRALKHSQVGILGQEAWLGLWRPGIQRLS